MSLLEVKHISTGYGKKQVLFDVSLDIIEGETLLVIGSNGSGKSTLFKAIYELLPLWQGEVTSTLTPLPIAKGTKLSEVIMYIPQKNELFEDMTVLDNIKMSVLHLNNKQEATKRLEQVLEQIPELKPKLKQNADRLSGGERKLVSLAMVMANKPKLLLYDEPLAGLSGNNITTLLHRLQKLKENGTTLVIIEHRIKELLILADRVIGLKLGKLHPETFKNLEDIKSFMV